MVGAWEIEWAVYAKSASQSHKGRRSSSWLYIKPGSPWESGHIESFTASCAINALTANSSAICTKHALFLESWRVEYNERRPAQRVWLSDSERICREKDELV
ncbi:MAG: integrase core domain-containing protein [Terrimicrobiaceae bacterium]